MTRRFRKSDITTHYSREYSGPAVNVKVYAFPHDAHPAQEKVMADFGCDRATAEKALEYAYESAQEEFWQQMKEDGKEIFGPRAGVYSMGRMGGWLYVAGIGAEAWEEWDAVKVAKWGRLVRACQSLIDDLTSWDSVRNMIEANRWAEPGAELHNFRDVGDDTYFKSECVVDAKRVRRAAPVLLAALKEIFDSASPHLDNAEDQIRVIRNVAREAIAAAEGSAVAV